eukprot:1567628-Pyramimonas_sp.AAC.1
MMPIRERGCQVPGAGRGMRDALRALPDDLPDHLPGDLPGDCDCRGDSLGNGGAASGKRMQLI